jgi:hypothetical protein
MLRAYLIPILITAAALGVSVLVQRKLSEGWRIVGLVAVANLLVLAGVLAWKTTDRLSGLLSPRSESPVALEDWSFGYAKPPRNSLKVLLGDALYVVTAESGTVLRLAGQDMVRVTFVKRPWPFADRVKVYARVFDQTGRIVGKVEGNTWTVNPNNYFKKEYSSHAIRVEDQFGQIFSIEFLNPDCVRILGTFRWAGRSIQALPDRLVLPGNNVFIKLYAEGGGTFINIR